MEPRNCAKHSRSRQEANNIAGMDGFKAAARALGARKEALEAEIASVSARLSGPGAPGLHGSLLDKEARARGAAVAAAAFCVAAPKRDLRRRDAPARLPHCRAASFAMLSTPRAARRPAARPENCAPSLNASTLTPPRPPSRRSPLAARRASRGPTSTWRRCARTASAS
jgi:hypothetical protein